MTDPALVRSGDFEAIEAAVMETARGRWFLNEYLKRYRSTDTAQVLQAIERLGTVLAHGSTAEPAVDPNNESRLDAISAAISAARAKVVEIAPAEGRAGEAPNSSAWSELLSGEVDTSRTLLESAGEIQEIGRRCRGGASSARDGDRLAERAGDIYAVCANQDLLRQRLAVVAGLMERLERIAAGVQADSADDGSPALRVSESRLEIEEVGARVEPVVDATEVGSREPGANCPVEPPTTPAARRPPPVPRPGLEIDSGVIALLGGATESPNEPEVAANDQSMVSTRSDSMQDSVDPTAGMSAAAIRAMLW